MKDLWKFSDFRADWTPSEKVFGKLWAWLWAGSPMPPLREKKGFSAVIIVSERLLAIWFYGSFKDT